MIQWLLVAALCFQTPDERPVQPDPVQVEAAVKELQQVFKHGDTEERIATIQKHGDLVVAEVVEGIAKGLKDKEPSVQLAALEALRWMPSPVTLKALHKTLAKDKKLKKDRRLYTALLVAIGQQGSPTSIEPLMDGALSAAPKAVTVARIYSLGHIRDQEALEALMDLIQRTSRVSKNGNAKQPMQKQFGIALEALTGQDFEQDLPAWSKWWRGNKKTFEVSPTRPKMGPKTQVIWTTYWTKPKDAKRGARKKRGDKRDSQ